jgi:hypothetical protein
MERSSDADFVKSDDARSNQTIDDHEELWTLIALPKHSKPPLTPQAFDHAAHPTL